MDLLVNRICEYIETNNMISKGDSIVAGVSGGADSVCLFHILCLLSDKYDLKITGVHINHGIRGEEAARDENFVVELMKKYGVQCKVVRCNVPEYARENGLTEEEAGRVLRYKAFLECGADKIAVAHHMDDSCETIIFNMCRGSGLKGIGGITPVRDNIIRPLLCADRSEIEEYLSKNKIEYIIDSTNMHNDYSRNKLRNVVIPYLKENVNSMAAKHIVALSESVSETEDYLGLQAKNIYDKYVRSEDGMYEISDGIKTEHIVLVKRVVRMVFEKCAGRLKDITGEHCRQVVKLFDKPVSKMTHLPYNMVARRTYVGVKIYIEGLDKDENVSGRIMKLTDEGEYEFEGVNVSLNTFPNLEKNHKIPQKMYTKWVDCDKIQDTVAIRHRLPGDYLIVDNAGSRKKLKDYFINEKIPREDRDDILLVADGSHIIWVVGYRISEFYKITDDTKNILEIEVR